MQRKLIRSKKMHHVNVGSIIIAQPFWQDETYMHSVIIVLDHDRDGSTGIILNKPSDISVKDALPVIGKDIPLFYGGPFDTHTISYIHNYPNVPDAVCLGNDLFWGGETEHLLEMIGNGKIQDGYIKFFGGFVEWKDGELEKEISQNKWWVSELTTDELFTTPAQQLWSHELLEKGNTYGILEELPDPSLN